jgi:RimJ/RimL family protein N-acetyltransferase
VSVSIRRTREDDVDFLVELVMHEDVEPFLGAVSAKERSAVAAEVERSNREPHDFGRFVIEVDGERAGAMGFEVENRRSQIAHLERLAVHPAFRGRRIADEAARLLQLHLVRDLGYHRLQLEIYGFNERAIAHAERAGFAREGVRRRAYWRHGEWSDGVLFALLADELDLSANVRLLHEYVRAHNECVRTARWDGFGSRFPGDRDDELLTFAVRETEEGVLADYGWRTEPNVVAGRLVLRGEDGGTIFALGVSES